MEAKQDGGAAFPFEGRENKLGMRALPASAGMTLRDYFAAQAMVRIVFADQDGIMSPEGTAFASYRLADAMLAERAK